MPVKDLVARYNAAPSPTTSRRDLLPPPSPSPSRPVPGSSSAEPESPAPVKERFLKHPLLHGSDTQPIRSRQVGLPQSDPPPPPPAASSSFPTTLDDPFEDTHASDDVSPRPAPEYTPAPPSAPPSLDARPSPRIPATSHFNRWISTTPDVAAPPDDDTSEYEMLLSKRTPYVPDSPSTFSPPHTSFSSTPTAFRGPSPSRTSTSTAVGADRARWNESHNPIPLSQIIARNAAPLHLPVLDKYIESLPAPDFERWQNEDTNHGRRNSRSPKPEGAGMFPPMDRLAATGHSIEDLETNSHIALESEQSFLMSLVNLFISVAGSSAVASYYSLQGIFNTVQIFALLLRTLVPVHAAGLGAKWRQLLLGTVPNVLALNFASTIVQSLILLLVFLTISTGLLYYFRRVTNRCAELQHLEGLQTAEPREYGRMTIVVTFLLTVIYLPVSTMAVHVLVWSSDLWVVPNPYVNATTIPPKLAPLGPSEAWRDPLDFCYTTTMRKDEINWSPVLVIVALVVSAMLTVWFPIRLHKALQLASPDVDKYNEFGALRSRPELDREYQRLLQRDHGPFSFLYREFRRGWATYESWYLFAKFVALLIVAALSPDNCLFRTLPRQRVAVVRQAVLLGATTFFFVVHCAVAPFLNPINNASEFSSRMNYVSTTLLALLVAIQVKGSSAFDGWVLYLDYVITYSFSLYFIIISTGFVQRWVKQLSGRLDFSVDMFSPRLDISPASRHTRRRTWQESLTTLFLTSTNCHIPREQKMLFAHAPDSEYPPYLLDFRGTPAERHIENIKILREVGVEEYDRAVRLTTGPDKEWFLPVAHEIQRHFVGPDCYWRDPAQDELPGCTNYFGNAWWIPFPPTLVMQYDDGPLVVIKHPHQLNVYLSQNRSTEIRRRRDIRMAIRSLDERVVAWPYTHVENVGSRGKRYKASTGIHFQHATLRIRQRGRLVWEKMQLGSGFAVELTYSKKVVVSGAVFGLDDEYDLTPALARFLQLNERLVPERLAHLEHVLGRYRLHYVREADAKLRALSYRFLSVVYNRPEDVLELEDVLALAPRAAEDETDERAKSLLSGRESKLAFAAAYQRLMQVATSETATWWYIFWDDLWRQNHEAIKQLNIHAADFNPHYPTSIAYTPLPRAALEAFLAQRGLLRRPSPRSAFFHAGLLNKLYLRLHDGAFRGSRRARVLHLGDAASRGAEGDLHDLDAETLGAPSTLGTGGGTELDPEDVVARPAFRWEGILADPYRAHGRRWTPPTARLGAWMGLSPHWAHGPSSSGVAVDARLENGRYVLVEPDERRDGDKDTASLS